MNHTYCTASSSHGILSTRISTSAVIPPSISANFGAGLRVLGREVSLRMLQSTHLYVAGTVGAVLIREVSLFQR